MTEREYTDMRAASLVMGAKLLLNAAAGYMADDIEKKHAGAAIDTLDDLLAMLRPRLEIKYGEGGK